MDRIQSAQANRTNDVASMPLAQLAQQVSSTMPIAVPLPMMAPEMGQGMEAAQEDNTIGQVRIRDVTCAPIVTQRHVIDN